MVETGQALNVTKMNANQKKSVSSNPLTLFTCECACLCADVLYMEGSTDMGEEFHHRVQFSAQRTHFSTAEVFKV